MTPAIDARGRRTAALLAAALASAIALPARAQSTTASARADALFVQGKAALEAGDFARACPQLQESYATDPSNGTLLALAVCHEGLGRLATAWREFHGAAEGASKEGRADRAQFAQRRIASLEPRISRLAVVVPADAPAGTGVDVDGTPLAQGDWGKPLPIDPGHHTVSVHSAARKPWSTSVDVGPEHDAQTVTVGALVPDAVAVPPVASTSPPPAPAIAGDARPSDAVPLQDTSVPGAWKRSAGWIVGGVGIVSLGIGTYEGVAAITKSSSAKSRCSPASCTDPGAVSENNAARSAATVSDVTLGIGLAAVVAGAYLLLTSPSGSPPAAGSQVAPFVGRQQAGLAFRARW